MQFPSCHTIAPIVLVLGGLALPALVSAQVESDRLPASFTTPWWEELGDDVLAGLLRAAAEANGGFQPAGPGA